MGEHTIRIHFEHAAAGGHLDDPQFARRIELGAEGFFQLRLHGRNADRVLIGTGDENDLSAWARMGRSRVAQRRRIMVCLGGGMG